MDLEETMPEEKEGPKKWTKEDVAPGAYTCLGPKRTVAEALEWLAEQRARLVRTIEAATKRINGEELTAAERRAVREDVSAAALHAWKLELARFDALVEAIKAADPAHVALRELASQHGFTRLVKGIRNKGCGLDLRRTIADMLNDGTLKEDGIEVGFACPSCGAPHEVFRTPPKPEPKPAEEAAA